MKLLWLGYLVYSLGNCAMKLCIETGLKFSHGIRAPLHPTHVALSSFCGAFGSCFENFRFDYYSIFVCV